VGKQVHADVSTDAVRAAANSHLPIVAELELYFSCLVRKQVRFRELSGIEAMDDSFTRVLPGFYAAFRAVTTGHCAIAGTAGHPPLEVMPVRHPERYVPDWVRIDYRRGQWLGEYGFTSRNRGALSSQSIRRHP
jgi:hypothetical protein